MQSLTKKVIRRKAAKPEEPSIVQPHIKIEGKDHAFETMFKTGDAPELVSVGYARLKPDSRDWVSYKITSKGEKILKVEVSEPNLQAIAEESAKIDFVQSFMDRE